MADLLQAAALACSTFYHQCQAILRNEKQSDMEVKIRAIYDEHKGRCGYRRITATLCRSVAQAVNHKCVQRLMQKMGLRALIWAKKRFQKVSGLSDVHVPNVLQRDFFVKAPNQKWATDVTEFNVHGRKLYLSARMDLYNGEIIAHRKARRPVFELVPLRWLDFANQQGESSVDLQHSVVFKLHSAAHAPQCQNSCRIRFFSG